MMGELLECARCDVLACRNVSAACADCNPEFATSGEKKRR